MACASDDENITGLLYFSPLVSLSKVFFMTTVI